LTPHLFNEFGRMGVDFAVHHQLRDDGRDLCIGIQGTSGFHQLAEKFSRRRGVLVKQQQPFPLF
jgi:hypothetical protein